MRAVDGSVVSGVVQTTSKLKSYSFSGEGKDDKGQLYNYILVLFQGYLKFCIISEYMEGDLKEGKPQQPILLTLAE